PLFNIKAYLPVVESTEFSHVLRNCTSEQAFPHLALDHWDMMPSDPLEEGSQANTLVKEIRKRKGLKEQITLLSDLEDNLSFDTSPVLEPEPTIKIRGTRFKTRRPDCFSDGCAGDICMENFHLGLVETEGNGEASYAKRKSSQQKLKRMYEKGDLTVGLLGEPSGKFDYYVLYPKAEPSQPLSPPHKTPPSPHKPPPTSPPPPKLSPYN
ncbi:elongation factor 2-like protein, partial [Tanacetum coccineum]